MTGRNIGAQEFASGQKTLGRVLSIVLLLTGIPPVMAGEITLKNGRLIRGRIVEKDDSKIGIEPQMDQGSGTLFFTFKEIETIVYHDNDPVLLNQALAKQKEAEAAHDRAITSLAPRLSPLFYELGRSQRHSGAEALRQFQYQTALTLFGKSIGTFHKAIEDARESLLETQRQPLSDDDKNIPLEEVPYRDEDLKFSIQFPFGWKAQRNSTGGAVEFNPPVGDADHSGANILVFTGPCKYMGLRRMQEQVGELLGPLPNLEIFAPGETRLGGRPSYQMAVRKKGSPVIEGTIVVTEGPGGLYYCVLTSQPLDSLGGKRREAFYQAIRSFRFIQ